MSQFQTTETESDGVMIVELHGYFSPEEVKGFEKKILDHLRAKKNRWVFDFSKSTFIASPGMAMFLELVAKIQEDFLGQVVFTGLDATKTKTFKMVGLLPGVPTCPTVQEAATKARA